MNKLTLSLLSLLLCSCATYKIEVQGQLNKISVPIESIEVKKENEWPGGQHCFEPMLFVLTLGIVPTHCIDTYKVSSESSEIGIVNVTKKQGWVALVLAALPSWQYGLGHEPENEIKNLVQVSK